MNFGDGSTTASRHFAGAVAKDSPAARQQQQQQQRQLGFAASGGSGGLMFNHVRNQSGGVNPDDQTSGTIGDSRFVNNSASAAQRQVSASSMLDATATKDGIHFSRQGPPATIATGTSAPAGMLAGSSAETAVPSAESIMPAVQQQVHPSLTLSNGLVPRNTGPTSGPVVSVYSRPRQSQLEQQHLPATATGAGTYLLPAGGGAAAVGPRRHPNVAATPSRTEGCGSSPLRFLGGPGPNTGWGSNFHSSGAAAPPMSWAAALSRSEGVGMLPADSYATPSVLALRIIGIDPYFPLVQDATRVQLVPAVCAGTSTTVGCYGEAVGAMALQMSPETNELSVVFNSGVFRWYYTPETAYHFKVFEINESQAESQLVGLVTLQLRDSGIGVTESPMIPPEYVISRPEFQRQSELRGRDGDFRGLLHWSAIFDYPRPGEVNWPHPEWIAACNLSSMVSPARLQQWNNQSAYQGVCAVSQSAGPEVKGQQTSALAGTPSRYSNPIQVGYRGRLSEASPRRSSVLPPPLEEEQLPEFIRVNRQRPPQNNQQDPSWTGLFGALRALCSDVYEAIQ